MASAASRLDFFKAEAFKTRSCEEEIAAAASEKILQPLGG